MLRTTALASILLAALAGQADAACQGVAGTDYCSKNFYGSGPCTGNDALATMQDSHAWPMSTAIPPWEPSSITITGVAITPLAVPSLQYAFAGNGYNPDIMAWWSNPVPPPPAGKGFKFPAAGTPAHIDLHYNCTSGTFVAFYTVFYTVP